MAEGKKAFVLYADLIHTVSKLSDLKAGKLLKIILDYVNDKNPKDPKDLVLSLAFEPVRRQLKRDLEKYEKKKKQWSLAGKASAAKRKQKSTNVNGRSTDSTVTVTDTVKDTVTVKVKDKGKVKENNNPLSHFGTKNYEITEQLDDEWLERIAKKYSLSITELGFELNEFADLCFEKGEVSKTVKDFKSHYVNLKNKRPDFLSNGTGNKIDWEKLL